MLLLKFRVMCIILNITGNLKIKPGKFMFMEWSELCVLKTHLLPSNPIKYGKSLILDFLELPY